MNRARGQHRFADPGFTLLEVMVALVILAVALAAAMRASSMSLDSGLALKQRALAGWVAENQLAGMMALQSWPAIGVTDGRAEQAGLAFEWDMSVSATPNPAFRRVEISVHPPGRRDRIAARVVAYLTGPLPP